jgi:hypothetical protein
MLRSFLRSCFLPGKFHSFTDHLLASFMGKDATLAPVVPGRTDGLTKASNSVYKPRCRGGEVGRELKAADLRRNDGLAT